MEKKEIFATRNPKYQAAVMIGIAVKALTDPSRMG